MIHGWIKETDGNRITIRIVLFGFIGKAFDLIDNSILITKILNLNLSVRITNWIKRKQRVKLATDCKSE